MLKMTAMWQPQEKLAQQMSLVEFGRGQTCPIQLMGSACPPLVLLMYPSFVLHWRFQSGSEDHGD